MCSSAITSEIQLLSEKNKVNRVYSHFLKWLTMVNTHTKFMVWNRNYICTSLIIGLAKESVPTPESVPLAKECCILFGQARFICPFLELVGEVIPSEHMDWEQSRSPKENWGCHVEKRNWYFGNRKIKISVSKYLETDYTFCILLGASG